MAVRQTPATALPACKLWSSPIMKWLIEDIRLTSGISRPQAENALDTMLRFLGARLPSPVMGRIQYALAEISEDEDPKNAGNKQ
jgi:hypothetical protein